MNSIFTGMYGGKNGINAYYQMYADPNPNCQTLAEYLTENGWYTCGDAMRLSLVSHKGFNKITSQEEIDDPDFVKIHSKILDDIQKIIKKFTLLKILLLIIWEHHRLIQKC